MAATALVASSIAAGNGTFSLADGASATLNIFTADGTVQPGMRAEIQLVASNGVNQSRDFMDANQPLVSVFGPGDFRVAKAAHATAFGIDKY